MYTAFSNTDILKGNIKIRRPVGRGNLFVRASKFSCVIVFSTTGSSKFLGETPLLPKLSTRSGTSISHLHPPLG